MLSLAQYMILDSAAGTDAMAFRPKEFYGWALPIVAQKSYQMRFRSLVDWQTMTIRCVISYDDHVLALRCDVCFPVQVL